MAHRLGVHALALVATIAGAVGTPHAQTGQALKRGAINGHIALTGRRPANPLVRMGMDPKCAALNSGKRVFQEEVVARADGSLANVFVRVAGSPTSPAVQAAPVVIDQQGCIYAPRVVGVRVGQVLQFRNSDPLLHNVHGVSARGNGFNIGEPTSGIVREFRLKDDEIMLRVICDVHRWMRAFVGVVSHPYFAVSDTAGNFAIADVPAGTHTLQIWHERYGVLTKTVRVTAGSTSTVEFAFTGLEKSSASAVRDLVLSEADARR